MLDQPTVWHEGERAVQIKRGVQDRLEALGKKVVRPYMPEQHREFFAMLETVHLSAVDAHGHPVVLTRTGPRGFLSSLDDRTLVIRSKPLPSEPANVHLAVGSKISVVGIEHETQRRNRLNATIKAVGRDTLHLHVDQSYGNCPKYIQVRGRTEGAAAQVTPTRYLPALDDVSSSQIRRADSLFIASRSAQFSEDPRTGVDVNHRGGMPGFVRVIDPYTIEFPDYRGNNFFNTLGNITQDSRVGLQFIDFATGDLLDIRGYAELRELVTDAETLTGTMVRIHLDEVARTAGAFPQRYALVSYSDRNPAV